MLFRRIIQPARGNLLISVEGYLVSVVAHTVLLAAFFVPRTGSDAPTELPESFEWARYLIPKDRPTGSAGVQERITYMAAAAPGGAGTELKDEKEPERLELEVPPGTKDDELAEVAVPPPPAPEILGEEVMTVLQVDTAAARVDESAAPPYPMAMLTKRIEGSVAVQYVVDTTGRADTASFVVLSTTHQDFARSVKATLPHMRFRAAIMNSQKVPQLVQQLFSFRIDTALFAQQQKKP